MDLLILEKGVFVNLILNMRPKWRFILSYIVIMGIVLFLLGYEPFKRIIDINGIYTRMIVYLTSQVLKPFHIVKTSHDSIIYLNKIALNVQFGCNGLEAFLIYTVGILAFPATYRKKIMGIVLGFLILQLLNIFRIALLAITATYYYSIFDVVHLYIAQGVMIAAALFIFLLWIKYANS